MRLPIRAQRGRKAQRRKRLKLVPDAAPLRHGGVSLDKEVWGEILKPFEEENNAQVSIEIIPWSNYEEKVFDRNFIGDRGLMWDTCTWR